MKEYFKLRITRSFCLAVLWLSLPCANVHSVSDVLSLEARVIRGGVILVLKEIEQAVEKEDRTTIRILVQGDEILREKRYWEDALEHLDSDDWKAQVYKVMAITYNRLRIYEKTIEFNINAGEEFLKLKMFKEAGDSFFVAASNFEAKLEEWEKAMEYNAKAGDCFFQAEKYNEAIVLYERAVWIALAKLEEKNYVKASEYKTRVGDCEMELSKYEKAAEVYKKVAEWYKKGLHNYIQESDRILS